MTTVRVGFVPLDNGDDVFVSYVIPRQNVQGTSSVRLLSMSDGQLGSYQMNWFTCALDCKCGGIIYERPGHGNHHPMIDIMVDSSDPYTWYPGMVTSDGITRLQS